MSRKQFAAHARRLLAFAWPVLVGQWATMAFSVIDTIMTGHSSTDDLAAMALGSAIYASVFVGLMGVLIALNPIIAQHFGADRPIAIGRSFSQGIWLAIWLTLIGWAVLSRPDLWLQLSHVSASVNQRVTGYLHALMYALPAALLFRTIYALNTAISRPKVVMAINLLGLCFKLPLNAILIFGKFGIPAFGAAGCGIATAVVMWCSCAIAFGILHFDPFYHKFQIRRSWPVWSEQRELLRLGIPTGLSYIVEVTSFTFMALLVARLGADVTGAHQIIANLAALCYMIPLAYSVATSTLTAQSVGAREPDQARQIVHTGLALAIGTAVIVVTTLIFSRDLILHTYTEDPAVIAIASTLLPLLWIYHILDATQSVAGFALRAYKRTLAPMLIYSVSLWGIGLLGGYWVAFRGVVGFAPQGVFGLWGSATASIAIASAALLWHLHTVTQGEIRKAKPFLKP